MHALRIFVIFPVGVWFLPLVAFDIMVTFCRWGVQVPPLVFFRGRERRSRRHVGERRERQHQESVSAFRPLPPGGQAHPVLAEVPGKQGCRPGWVRSRWPAHHEGKSFVCLGSRERAPCEFMRRGTSRIQSLRVSLVFVIPFLF